MAISHPNTWKWLPLIALGLMLVSDFAPVPDSLDDILTGVAIAVLLILSGSYYWQQLRERHANQSDSAAISSSDQT